MKRGTTVCAATVMLTAVLAVFECRGELKMPRNGIIVGETTVATVNGWRVGGGNYFMREDGAGKRRPSVSFAIWDPAKKDGKALELTLFPGDVFTVGARKYRLHSVDPGRDGGNGAAVIVPVD